MLVSLRYTNINWSGEPGVMHMDDVVNTHLNAKEHDR